MGVHQSVATHDGHAKQVEPPQPARYRRSNAEQRWPWLALHPRHDQSPPPPRQHEELCGHLLWLQSEHAGEKLPGD